MMLVLLAALFGLWAVFSASYVWIGRPKPHFSSASFIVAAALTMSLFWLLVFFPGRMTVDSLASWKEAGVGAYSTYQAPFVAMLMRMTQAFCDGPALYAFLQGWAFWAGILFVLRQVIKNDKGFLFASLLFLGNPALWIYTSTIVSNVFSAAFALVALGCFLRLVQTDRFRYGWLGSAALALALCFRHDPLFLAVVPLLCMGFGVKGKKGSRSWAAMQAVGMTLLVLVPGRMIERLPSVVDHNTPYGFALINQYVGTVYHARGTMNPEAFEQERVSMDERFGRGTLERLLKYYQCDSANYMTEWEGHHDIIRTQRIRDEQDFIVHKVITAASTWPGAYLEHKSCNLAHVLQVPGIQYFYAVGYRIEEDRHFLKGSGIEYDSYLPALRDRLLSDLLEMVYSPKWMWLFRHWIYLVICAVVLVLGLLRKTPEMVLPGLVGLLSFLGFVVPDAFPDWRHLLLVYLCGWLSLAGLVGTRAGFKAKHSSSA